MSLNPLKHDLEGCTLVRIHAEMTVKGCYIGVAHGWACSLPGGDKLDRVFLVGDEVGPDLEESVGPELDNASNTATPFLERAISAELWLKARSGTVTVELQEAYAANRMERAA